MKVDNNSNCNVLQPCATSEHEYGTKFLKILQNQGSHFQCLKFEEVEKLFHDSIKQLCLQINVNPSIAILLLQKMQWSIPDITKGYMEDAHGTLVAAQATDISNPPKMLRPITLWFGDRVCPVCLIRKPVRACKALACGHQFCADCWLTHLSIQIKQGVSTRIECMAPNCVVLVPYDFALATLIEPALRDKYLSFAFRDSVQSHPQLMFCPGSNCTAIGLSKEPLKAERINCNYCHGSWCVKCREEYHTPATCELIKRWLIKNSDDSETQNYKQLYTKQCPNCHVAIAKEYGCDHMCCRNCSFDFCWLCLQDLREDDRARYAHEGSVGCRKKTSKLKNQLRPKKIETLMAFTKYMKYVTKWDHHSREAKMYEKESQRVRDHRLESHGTLGDAADYDVSDRNYDADDDDHGESWQQLEFLVEGSTVLAKYHSALKYSYSCLYYMENGYAKRMLETRQYLMEKEIAKLSEMLRSATDKEVVETKLGFAIECYNWFVTDFQKHVEALGQ